MDDEQQHTQIIIIHSLSFALCALHSIMDPSRKREQHHKKTLNSRAIL
jgi:hypothetical protein